MQLVGLLDRLDDRRRDARHVLDGRLDLLGRRRSVSRSSPYDLDGDLGVHAGEHVADQVRQRLLDLDVDAGHFLAQLRRAAAAMISSRLAAARPGSC